MGNSKSIPRSRAAAPSKKLAWKMSKLQEPGKSRNRDPQKRSIRQPPAIVLPATINPVTAWKAAT